MKRNPLSLRGDSQAFTAAAEKAAEETRQPFSPVPESPSTRCDRSGDIGSTHIFRLGAADGDHCVCGRRVKVVMEPCHSCHAKFPLRRLTERQVLTAKQTFSSPAEYETVYVCDTCQRHCAEDRDEAYERAQRSDEWERRGGGGL